MNARPEKEPDFMLDPIVKVGTDPLSAADIIDWMSVHPERAVRGLLLEPEPALERDVEEPAQHPGEGADFDRPNDGRRTNVR